MRFALIDEAKEAFPVHRMCQVLGVSQSGYFAWKHRAASNRQREDMVLLAHVRSAFAQSNGTYGSPRMTRELQDDGLAIGRRRTARLMRTNGLQARQKRRFKRTTDGQPACLACGTQHHRAGFCRCRPGRKVGRRYFVLLDARRMAVSGGRDRPVLAAGHWLGRQ